MKHKVRVEASWSNSKDITKRLLDQFYINQDLSNIEFVYEGECDFLFYFGFEKGDMCLTCKKKYLFSMEPTWSGNFPRNRSDTNIIAYVQSKEAMVNKENVIESPTYMFYGAGGEGWTYDNIAKHTTYNKTKNISSIVSTLRNQYKYTNCLYDQRRSIITSILASNVDVDVFGWPLERFPKALPLPYKKDGLIPYKFSLAIENTSENNYITEKFYDPIITNTVPIYFGAPNIKELFPEKGYFHIEDLTDTYAVLDLLEYININADKLYEEMLPEAQKIKNRFFSEFNLLNKILELVND